MFPEIYLWMMFEIVNMDMKIDFVSEVLNWEINLPFMPCVKCMSVCNNKFYDLRIFFLCCQLLRPMLMGMEFLTMESL